MSIVYYSTPTGAFSELYLTARTKEHRFYSQEQIAKLPDIEKNHSLYNEWRSRKKSALRFVKHLEGKARPLKILDVGCGNGWFSNFISNVRNTEVIGIDINLPELEQADAVFKKPNLVFAHADLFEDTRLSQMRFDIIVFNSCFQYFEHAASLLTTVSGMLAGDGEIHIIDTPFYTRDQLQDAKARTHSYYENLGVPKMSEHYFHHNWDELPGYKICYKPSLFAKLLNSDSPFCWIALKK